jgi:hypothetical protein
MQTIVFTENAATLRDRLEVNHLVDLLRVPIEEGGNTTIGPADRSEFFRLILSAHTGLLKTTDEGGPGQQLAQVFGLDVLLSSGAIEHLIFTLTGIPDFERLQQETSFRNLYFSLKEFQTTVNTSVSLLQGERIPMPEEGTVVLEIEIPVDSGNPSAHKFGEAIQQVAALHSALCRYVLGHHEELVILYLDSGGSLLVGLQCNADVSKQIREMFASAVWAIRFHKNERFERNVGSAVAALALLGQLDEAVVEGRISEGDAEVTKRAITKSMKFLLSAGVLPRDMLLEEETASEVLWDLREPLMLQAGEEGEEEEQEEGDDASPDPSPAVAPLRWRRPVDDTFSEADPNVVTGLNPSDA